jgi:hypothetical protein
VWGAVFALANAANACQGFPIGFANPLLYEAAATSLASAFNDVSAGNNDFTGSNGGRYPAGPGYDMATGLGSPNVASLVAVMCAHAIQNHAPTISGVSVSGLRSGRPKLQFTATQGQNASALKRLVIQLPKALRFSRKLRHITVIGPRRNRALFHASLRHGILTIILNNSKNQVKVTISYDTLTATRREVTAARRRRAGKLRISVGLTDAASRKAQLAASVKPRN